MLVILNYIPIYFQNIDICATCHLSKQNFPIFSSAETNDSAATRTGSVKCKIWIIYILHVTFFGKIQNEKTFSRDSHGEKKS